MYQYCSRNLLAFLVFLCLTACGGGSDSPADSGTNTQPISQAPLTFEQATVSLSIGDAVPTNPLSGGSGSGGVTYSSSNQSVATVDTSSGALTLVAPGSTTITATKAANSNYLSASASYTLVITKAEQEPLVFAEELIEIYIDESVPENSLQGGSGSGALSYASSDLTVAIVDAASGIVTVQGDGTVEITATKQGDDSYAESTDHYTLVINKYEQQALAFASDQISGATTTQAPENSLTGGEGDGEIIYSSSDSAVASVNSETGAVSLLTEGTVIITAIKASDSLFAASQASYEVIAFDVIADLEIQMGLSDARITWKSQHNIIETFRTSQFNCNVDNYPSCSNGRLRRFNQPPVTSYTDTFPKIGNLAYLYVQSPDYRSSQIRLEPTPLDVPLRWSHSLTTFKDRLWIIGGALGYFNSDEEYTYIYYNDIWSSEDGITWKLEAESAEFTPREDHIILELNDELYLFSGWVETEGGGSYATREVWKSTNGINWVQLTESNSPISNYSGNVTVFDGKFWAVSSTLGDTPSNQVWSSEDAVNWNLELSLAPFEQRNAFTLYTNDEYLYMMGGFSGYDSSEPYFDVWMSSNGVQWDRVAETGGYGKFYDGSIVRLADKFYALGGWGSNSFEPDVFVSDNGINWSKLPESDTNIDTSQFNPVIFKDSIFLSILWGPSRFVWSTTNGVNWRVPVDVSNITWQALD